MASEVTPSLKTWHVTLRAHGCVICRNETVHLHHCHGGSMVEALPASLRPGMGQRASDWLVIPLHPCFHVGVYGIDNGQGRFKGVAAWEANLGTQVAFLDRLCREYRINVWALAGVLRDPFAGSVDD